MAPALEPETLLKRPLYVYDLPEEILDTLHPKLDDAPSTVNTSTSLQDDVGTPIHSPAPASIEKQNDENPVTVSCSLCGLTFKNYHDQRLHARTDLHSYNLKLKLRGSKPVNEADFEKVVGELDESISGSDSSDSDTSSDSHGDPKDTSSATVLSKLLKKQAKLEGDDDTTISKRRRQTSGKPPLVWFTSSILPSNTSLGIYRAIFTTSELQDTDDFPSVIRNKQLSAARRAQPQDSEGGVPLPQAHTHAGPHIFMCMIGGGHFAAMVVALAPKAGKKQGAEERQATVLAHKTFHRYTTRRKQGGAQSANDNANGKAKSAGSSLRRYNEMALEQEIRRLLEEWKSLINTSELIFARASGTTSRRTLFGPYDDQVLRHDDSRNRGFPFNTRRATQGELMRAFVELTRVKVSQVDEAALAAAEAEAAKAAEAHQQAAAAKIQAAATKAAQSKLSPEDEAALQHTTQVEALIRRSKVPPLLSYITTNSLSPDFLLYPSDSQAHYHAPTMLHLAASVNTPALITALLVKAGANPTITSKEGKTAFSIAGDRPTRDAFRLARSELGEDKWPWNDAHIPEPLTKAEIDERNERERVELTQQEESRRKAEMERIKEEEKQRAADKRRAVDERREKTMGKGRKVQATMITAEERREEEARGMTPEMKMRLEREKRARAAEERMKRLG